MLYKYMREGRGWCKDCARELDTVKRYGTITRDVRGPVLARHLRRIEEFTAKGARPEGFCERSLDVPDPIPFPETSAPGRVTRR